eukprot:1622384-Amphidinium_carterae.1
MRLTEVHKPLASAPRALRQNIAFLTGEGGVEPGVLFPRTACQVGNLKGLIRLEEPEAKRQMPDLARVEGDYEIPDEEW